MKNRKLVVILEFIVHFSNAIIYRITSLYDIKFTGMCTSLFVVKIHLVEWSGRRSTRTVSWTEFKQIFIVFSILFIQISSVTGISHKNLLPTKKIFIASSSIFESIRDHPGLDHPPTLWRLLHHSVSCLRVFNTKDQPPRANSLLPPLSFVFLCVHLWAPKWNFFYFSR